MIRRQRGFTLIELMVVVAILAILSTMLFGVMGKTYGASPQSTSDEVREAVALAKLRAISSRRIHMVEIQPTRIILWQATTTGFAAPVGWALVQTFPIPKGVKIFNVSSTIYANAGVATVTENTSLDNTTLMFKPDSSSTGGTIFVGDSMGSRGYRVFIYRATGAARAKSSW